MIRAAAAALGLAAFVGCAGRSVKPEDLELTEQRLRAQISDELSSLRKEFGELVNQMERMKVLMQQLEILRGELERLQKQVEKGSADSQQKIDRANTNVVKSLEIQEQYLRQELESIRALIDQLKK